jgi:MFS family permease
VILAVVVSSFFVGFGGGVVFPILPNLGTILGISPFLVGVILSANRFVRILANAPAGSLVDRIGTRTPLVVGLFVEAVATAGYWVALDAPVPEAWFLGARVVWGLGSALVFATAYTIAADVSEGDSRGASVGVVRGGLTLGFPAGLVVGGVASELYGEATAFLVAAGFAFCACLIAYATVPETHVEGPPRAVTPWEVDRRTPTLAVGAVNFGLYFAYLGALFATLVLLLEARSITVFGFGPQGASGVVMGVTVVAASGLTFAGGAASDKTGSRVPVLLAFLLVSFVGFLALALAGSLVGLVAACLLIGAGQGGTSGPLVALLADLTPDDRMGRAMGTNNVMGDLGGGLGPVVTLPLLDVVGFAGIYAACAVVPLLAGGLLLAGLYVETGRIDPQRATSVESPPEE